MNIVWKIVIKFFTRVKQPLVDGRGILIQNVDNMINHIYKFRNFNSFFFHFLKNFLTYNIQF